MLEGSPGATGLEPFSMLIGGMGTGVSANNPPPQALYSPTANLGWNPFGEGGGGMLSGGGGPSHGSSLFSPSHNTAQGANATGNGSSSQTSAHTSSQASHVPASPTAVLAGGIVKPIPTPPSGASFNKYECYVLCECARDAENVCVGVGCSTSFPCLLLLAFMGVVLFFLL
jgi:hypothetical protein